MFSRASAYFARFGARHAARTQAARPDPMIVYPIRYTRRPYWRTGMKWLGIVSACFMGFNVLQAVALAPLQKAVLEQLKLLPPDELKRLLREASREQSEWRIPIPFTLTYLKPEPYDPTGPEWKEFVRISKDVSAMKSIVNEVRDTVHRELLRHLNGSLGSSRFTRHWMGVEFPERPTQGKWVQTEWATDGQGAGFRERILPWETGLMWWRITSPWGLPWAFGEAFLRYYWTLGKTSVGWAADQLPEVKPLLTPFFGDGNPDPKAIRVINDIIPRSPNPTQQSTQQDSKVSSGAGSQSSNGKEGQASQSPAMKTSSQPNSSSSNTAASPGREASELSNNSSPKRSPDLEQMIGRPLAWFYDNSKRARSEFWYTLNRKWNMPGIPTRDLTGCVAVSGPMHLQCEYGYWVVYVYALWDPKEETVPYCTIQSKRFFSKRKPPGLIPPTHSVRVWW